MCVGSVFRSLDKSFVESSHGGFFVVVAVVANRLFWALEISMICGAVGVGLYFIGQIMPRRRRVN